MGTSGNIIGHMKKTNLTIDDLSLSFVPKGSKVLELGSGEGRLTFFLSNKLKCNVTAVDKDKVKAKLAGRFADMVIVGDAESSETQEVIENKGKFNVIYASALLAHLVDPESFLKKARKWISPEGILIATFPNHAHWIIRKNLLFGRFEYESSGLYDKTHLHIFTSASMRILLNESGFKIESWDMESYGFWMLEKLFFFVPKNFFRRIYAFFPNLFAYQFVFCAKLK